MGVDEEFFTHHEYSESSNVDSPESFNNSELGISLDITPNWDKSSQGEYHLEQNSREISVKTSQNYSCGVLPSINTFGNVITQLTPLEPMAPVIVQDAHGNCWGGNEQTWDESKTLSLLDANLDFENLVDLVL